MSETDPSEALAPTATEGEHEPAAAAPEQELAPPSAAGPYRVPDPPEPAPAPPIAPPRSAPVLGPALTVYAVLLWSFVVAGQFATSWSLGRPLANGVYVTMVAATTAAAWITSVRASCLSSPPRSRGHLWLRAVGVGVVAVVLFAVTVIAATAVGIASARSHDLAIAVGLVVVALLAGRFGPRLTSPVRPQRTHQARVAYALVWAAGALLTLVAGADLATNG